VFGCAQAERAGAGSRLSGREPGQVRWIGNWFCDARTREPGDARTAEPGAIEGS
jgi:hypothetical protein